MLSARKVVAFAALTLSCCVPALPSHHRSSGLVMTQDQTAQVQSVSGRITSVEGNAFTLEMPQSRRSHNFQQDEQKVMTFTVDQNTTVEGKIEVGASADVTYRVQDGNNIAVSVRVTPPQS